MDRPPRNGPRYRARANAEIRKNVLKYDEVMNQQRKVIYRRRSQILDLADLRDEAVEYLADAVESTLAVFCPSDYAEEWDIDGLLGEITSFWPSVVTSARVAACKSTDQRCYGSRMRGRGGFRFKTLFFPCFQLFDSPYPTGH